MILLGLALPFFEHLKIFILKYFFLFLFDSFPLHQPCLHRYGESS